MKYGLADKDIALIQKICGGFSQIKEAVLFGSRAMGNFKKGSDVDIALKGSLDDSLLNRFRGVLEEEIPLPYFFDVIAYESIESNALKEHVDQYGKAIYQRSPA